MTFLELLSSCRPSKRIFLDTIVFLLTTVTEFHRKAEDNIPMVRLRAPAAVRADQDPGHSADVCMNTRTQSPPRNQQTVPRNHLAHLHSGISTILHFQCSHIATHAG